MIIGIGFDLISNQRIKKILEKFGDDFKQKIFSKNELADFQQRFDPKKLGNNVKINQDAINFFAKRFAAKEAFSKAIGTGIGRGVNFNDIEIYNDKLGKPNIKIINDKDQKILKILQCEKINIHLTLTDEKSISGAVVIIEKAN